VISRDSDHFPNSADVMAAALKEFIDKYGEAAGETVLAYQNSDFDQLR